MQTSIYRIDKQQGPTYSPRNYIPHPVTAIMEKNMTKNVCVYIMTKNVCVYIMTKNVCVYICIIASLCCAEEINTIL